MFNDEMGVITFQVMKEYGEKVFLLVLCGRPLVKFVIMVKWSQRCTRLVAFATTAFLCGIFNCKLQLLLTANKKLPLT